MIEISKTDEDMFVQTISVLQDMLDEADLSEYEALKTAIKALEQEPCEDCISRQAVIDINGHHYGQMPKHVNHEIWKEIKALPSVTPKERTGKWIIIDDCERFIAKCSECGRIEDSRMINKYPYCHCGTKMEVSE